MNDCSLVINPRTAGAAPVGSRLSPLGRFQRFLMATDGSRFAEAAAVTAASLGSFCKSGVTVTSVTTASHSPERRAEAQQAVDHVLEHMTDQGIAAQGVVLEGEPSDVIAGLAREKKADLIVTGSHGRTGLERVLLGSTSERILNETPCAVLVVKVA